VLWHRRSDFTALSSKSIKTYAVQSSLLALKSRKHCKYDALLRIAGLRCHCLISSSRLEFFIETLGKLYVSSSVRDMVGGLITYRYLSSLHLPTLISHQERWKESAGRPSGKVGKARRLQGPLSRTPLIRLICVFGFTCLKVSHAQCSETQCPSTS